MLHSPNAQRAYGQILGSSHGPSQRGEYAVFARVTAMLRAANIDKPPVGHRAQALHDNRRLWIEVGAQVADEKNELPFELRQRLFALSAFVQSYSAKALQGRLSLEPLIEINRSIMTGLQAQTGVAA